MFVKIMNINRLMIDDFIIFLENFLFIKNSGMINNVN